MKLEGEEFKLEYKLNEYELMVFWNDVYDVNYYIIQLSFIDNGNYIKIYEQKINSNQTFCKIPSISYGEYIVSLIGLKDDNIVLSKEIKFLNDSKAAKKLKKEKENELKKINKRKAKERRNRKFLDILEAIGSFFATIFVGIGKFFSLIFEFIGEHIKKILITIVSLAALAGIAVSIIFIVKGCQKEKIYMGLYPQTFVTNNGLCKELNNLAGNLPSESNLNEWNDYNYYISSEEASYMYYKDVNYENNKYRGVYFTKFRPVQTNYSSNSSNTNIDNNGYTFNEIYWFKFEPIEWIVIKEDDNNKILITNMILDSQHYYISANIETFEHNGGIGYTNNYELSDIRKWLNNDFYNLAFNIDEKALIQETKIDNSLESTTYSSNNYICSNTYDNIYLLSKKEASDFFKDDGARVAFGSDYAKCQGLYTVTKDNYASHWWLRSPYFEYTDASCIIESSGSNNYYISSLTTSVGIRPAITIKK